MISVDLMFDHQEEERDVDYRDGATTSQQPLCFHQEWQEKFSVHLYFAFPKLWLYSKLQTIVLHVVIDNERISNLEFFINIDKFFQFVVLTFWGIYAIDRELVYPKALDKVIPSWLNHIMVIYTYILAIHVQIDETISL